MPDYYIALKAITPTLNVFEGNDVLHVLTALPRLEDFNEAKARYCELMLKRNIIALPDQVIITMCVPIY